MINNLSKKNSKNFFSFKIKPIISISEVIRHNDAFIVVYAITDKASFILAIDLIKSIRVNEANRPIILVGNKSDLVRKRVVNRDGNFIFC